MRPATARYTPLNTPNWSGVRRSWNTRYSGRMAVTISEDTSVNRLVRPRHTTFADTHGRGPKGSSDPAGARSATMVGRTDGYISGPERRYGRANLRKPNPK